YMRRLSNYPALSPEEQFELVRRYQNKGDQDAGCILIYSNLRLVVKIAMKYQRKCMNNNLDLIQEGNVGLMKAVNKFDPERGIKFSYYASFWIKAYILKYIMDNARMVKIGTSQAQRSLFYNLSKEKQRLESLGADSGTETISRNLDIPESDVVQMGQILKNHDISLDMPYSENTDKSPGDIIPDPDEGVEETFSQKETREFLRDKLKEMLPVLNYREKDIIRLRLMTDSPLTLEKIGEKYDITRERVRQIESKLVGKIKGHIENKVKDFSRDWLDYA
ncbi:MAG: RNA polymerase factor sigma-32, partial [Desulfovibrionales bacterium]|nr:RNA polymerase factor sigma-32 [Desulfovibrionales bacterium]